MCCEEGLVWLMFIFKISVYFLNFPSSHRKIIGWIVTSTIETSATIRNQHYTTITPHRRRMLNWIIGKKSIIFEFVFHFFVHTQTHPDFESTTRALNYIRAFSAELSAAQRRSGKMVFFSFFLNFKNFQNLIFCFVSLTNERMKLNHKLLVFQDCHCLIVFIFATVLWQVWFHFYFKKN